MDVLSHSCRDGRSDHEQSRLVRGVALGRKSWLFAGSDRGGERAAVMYTLIQTARLNDVDPQAWLANVLAHINARSTAALELEVDRCQARRLSTPRPKPTTTPRSVRIRRFEGSST